MASTPKKSFQSPSKSNLRSQFSPTAATPVTPQSLPPRRSTRLKSIPFNPPVTPHGIDVSGETENQHTVPKTRKARKNLEFSPRSRRSIDYSCQDKLVTRSAASKRVNKKESVKPSKNRNGKVSVEVSFAPTSPEQSEIKKRKRKGQGQKTVVSRTLAVKKGEKSERVQKSRSYYRKAVYDGGEFEVGDDVYVKRREDATSDEEDPEVEECRLCFSVGDDVMIECDDCLGGFHLKCLKPPLKDVPEGDWICGFCDARKMGRNVDFPKPPKGKKLVRTMAQRVLSSDMWAAHIERCGISSMVQSHNLCAVFLSLNSNYVDVYYGLFYIIV